MRQGHAGDLRVMSYRPVDARVQYFGQPYFHGTTFRVLGPAGYGDFVRERVGSRAAFLSFDVDFCDPAYGPGTGTLEVGGFSSAEAQAFLSALAGIELAGADVVEVSPPYDGAGQPNALLGANVAWEVLALVAVQRRENGGTGK